ncbi:MAG TPA: sigma-54 dependent transcriptional regulator [Polyangiaceae bacterium]|jgi:DNA-binding NtrC family response regulator
MLDLLLVDDDASTRLELANALRKEGHSVTEAADGGDAIRRLSAEVFDVVVTDMRMPQADGRAVLRTVRHESPSTDVIVMTSFGDVADAVSALKGGAYDYLTKPFEIDEMLLRLRRIIDTRALQRELAAARAELARCDTAAMLVGQSPAMTRLRELVATVAPSDASVLILGETGAGKEVVARTLHAMSSRHSGPFVAVNCAAFPETLLEAELFGHERGAFTGAVKRRDGRFKAAHRGTLMLDELGEMPLAAQAKLLRVLEERTIEPLGSHQPVPIDVRVVSATHRDLRRLIREGRFREDLYFRLRVVTLDVPPLRERRSDLALLVQHFAKKYSRTGEVPQISLAAWGALSRYGFPGNVRELAHVVQHALVLTRDGTVELEHLPRELVGNGAPEPTGATDSLSNAVRSFERDYLLRALTLTGGRRARTAEILGISRKTLWEKVRSLGIADADLQDD